MGDVEHYWKAVNPKTDAEYRQACAYIREKYPDAIISRRRAEEIGLPIYRMKKSCKRGHRSWRYVNGQACIACMRIRPDGKLARHRRPKMRRMTAVTRDLMRDAPDLIISRHDAETAGLTAYRLGEPCGICHKTTWRHIDTLACVECTTHAVGAGLDMAFEESFQGLREIIDTLEDDQLKAIEKDLKNRIKKDPQHVLDFNRALRFVRRHIRERKK